VCLCISASSTSSPSRSAAKRMCFNTRLLPQKLLLAVEWATWVLLQLLLMFQQTEVHHTNIGGAGGADAETQPAVGTPRPGYGM
jgi:hypothetical protein